VTAETAALRGAPRALHAAARSARLRAAGIHALRLTYRSRRPLVSNRHELPVLLNRRGLVGCAAEVGVRAGEFSASILERWEGRHLIAIDPWATAPEHDYVDIANVSEAEHERLHEAARDRLARFGERSSIWRMTGDEAAERIPHHSLDFVYLDARHDRASVEHDLAVWLPLVRPDGILAGHDYLDGDFPPHGRFGVRSAVDSFFEDRGLAVHATLADRPWVSWFASIPVGTGPWR
jgi:hypothetical protein